MNIAFRVDASAAMGSGHVMRCLTLAEGLRARGARVSFVCREYLGNLIALISKQAIPVTILPPPAVPASAGVPDYAAWLGVTQREDAAQTIAALRDEHPDVIIVDHYGLNAAWERELRTVSKTVLAIDDLANRRHDCDILLDQNYSVEGRQRYAGLVPKGCLILTGPRYALVGPEYLAVRSERGLRAEARRVFVFFGASDPHGMSLRALEALLAADLGHLEIDLVVGANIPDRERLVGLAATRPGTYLHGPVPTLAWLMSQADIAIGGAGTTTWERMCLGLPSVVVCVAENQRGACEALSRDCLIEYAGDSDTVDVQYLAKILKELASSPVRRQTLSIANQALVDGRGVSRIVETLITTPADELRLVHPPVAKSSAVEQSSHSFLILAGSLEVGEVDADLVGNEARLRYSMDPIIATRRLDARIIAMVNRAMYDSEPRRVGADGGAHHPLGTGKSLLLKSENGTRSAATEDSLSRIAILSDRSSWVDEYIPDLVLEWLTDGRSVQWCHDARDLIAGDVCFYLSCSEIVRAPTLSLFRHSLVVHGSDLPRGRGWSPLTWQILEGESRIPITLFEAAANVDRGVIYAQTWVEFEGHELIDELRAGLMLATRSLCNEFLVRYPGILQEARQQTGDATYYSRRSPADSQLSADQSIDEQFPLFRVADNSRYPTFFERQGHRYTIRITKS